MKRLIFICILLLNCIAIKSQNSFEIGLKHFKKGEYSIADSLFTLYLKEFPKDIGAQFNHGAVKLYLGDTCSFCKEMFDLCHYSNDGDACYLYIKTCEKTDTLFYNKQYKSCNKEMALFTEIIGSHKYYNFKTIFIHNKKSKTDPFKANYYDAISPIKSDIVAIYRIYNDSSKVFLFSLTPPSFTGDGSDQTEFRLNNPIIQQTRSTFNLHNVIATVEYIVDKNGKTKEGKLISVSSPIDQIEEFKKYINLIILKMPKRNPAKYQHENVDYLVEDYISF